MRLAGRPARPGGPRRSGGGGAAVVQRAEQVGRGDEGKWRRQCRQVGPGHRWERERVLAGFARLRERVLGLACTAGEREWLKRTGPARRGRPGKGVARAGLGSGERAGRARMRGLGRGKRWAGFWVWVMGSFSISFSFLFLNFSSPNSNKV